MYVIRNGIIIQPDRLLFGYELVVEGDRITAIQRQGTLDAEACGFGAARGEHHAERRENRENFRRHNSNLHRPRRTARQADYSKFKARAARLA